MFPSRTLLLPFLAPRYRFRRTGQALLGLKPCGKRSRGCLPKEPQKSLEIRVSAFTVVFSWWRRCLVTHDLSLSQLNEFVHLTRFKMETVASVLLSVREGDFLASLDLKDAYFQIPIHPSSRRLLRFTSEGTVYQFRTLCFGLSTAPQVFTRVFAAVSAWAHSHRIRLLRYLDDWLILASSEQEAKQAVQSLLSLCRTLGIVINEKKSDLMPSQTAKYLGMTIDTEAGKVFRLWRESRNSWQ